VWLTPRKVYNNLLKPSGFPELRKSILPPIRFRAENSSSKGLVDYLVPKPDLEEFTHTYAQKITRNAPLSLKCIKNIISMFENDLALNHQNMEKADRLMQKCFQSDDLKEGQAAFLERRAPKFTGK
jgi:1,4-dihydroxy-2-naphthoyl-CoA synthase